MKRKNSKLNKEKVEEKKEEEKEEEDKEEKEIKKPKIMKITKNQLLSYTLKQHGLINRFTEIKKNIPLHSTLNTTPFLSHLARVESFDYKDFLKMFDNEELLTLRCMRGTLHTVHNEIASSLFSIYGEKKDDMLEKFGMEEEDFKKTEKIVIKSIKKNGPQSSTTIKKHFKKEELKQYETSFGKYYNTAITMKVMYQVGKILLYK
jgi:hypothetical protein